MIRREASVVAQLRGWSGLGRLNPAPIDLGRISLLREAPIASLRDQTQVEALLARLGLNDERSDEWPPELAAFLGRGLSTTASAL
ncbi:MAG: hypothetical protein HY903_00230 [Deltaproteobacteria bacterium]|nr:hypothetical protein [Deltaproteobacteria bacterium]